MINLIQARMPEHRKIVQELFAEYFNWVCTRIYQDYKVTLDAESMIAHDVETIDVFLPPKGVLLLALDNDFPAGCACMRTIGEGVAEIKRMFVRPNYRRKGIGGQIVGELIRQVKDLGYQRIRLDSSEFMSDAHRVYRSHGFAEIPPYKESEVPEQYRRQ